MVTGCVTFSRDEEVEGTLWAEIRQAKTLTHRWIHTANSNTAVKG